MAQRNEFKDAQAQSQSGVETHLASEVVPNKAIAAAALGQAIRDSGHLAACTNPLGDSGSEVSLFQLESHGLLRDDLAALGAQIIGGPAADGAASALEVIDTLHSVYCGPIGYDYAHVHFPEERLWLRNAAESRQFHLSRERIDPVLLLERLTQVEAFEQFLGRVFPGKFRFSLEGLDALVPMLDELISTAAQSGVRNLFIGMGHRGRLNVMAHVLNTPFDEILAEFKDPLGNQHARDGIGWTGDVKYHRGARLAVADGAPSSLVVTLAPNPSHVEAINPVVTGMARAGGCDANQPGPPRLDLARVLPILIHGDAAFPGQGVNAETMNLSRVPGYESGGTIHIIANNQIGFTTRPHSSRSTLYASDLAKGFEIPIVHVNADEPDACIEAALLALAYRTRFQRDFMIDLVGYRRHGHNESDEPSFTEPVLYRAIESHPTVRELWAKVLVNEALIPDKSPSEMLERQMKKLQQTLDSMKPERIPIDDRPEEPPPGAARHTVSAVPLARLRGLVDSLWKVPDGFSLHPKVARVRERSRQALDQESLVGWATAEELAFGSILEDGIPIRISGEDSERGTFSQRHAAFYDTETGQHIVRLQTLSTARAAFEVCNSPLSENAVVGFEFGFNIQKPEQLVIWEAQYGDFANGAQIILDEFIVSARAKWGQRPSLVLLLPHGYEGQGPNHSSCRVERFLNLAVDINLRIANCTTAAQYFHLLRRQAALLRQDPLPLIVLTPKGVLRDPRLASPLEEFVTGGWNPVIVEPSASAAEREKIHRLVLCSGKIYLELDRVERPQNSAVVVARVEQLYPYPSDGIESILASYPQLDEVYWVQEEPENMGAWNYLRPHLTRQLDGRWPLYYTGRPPSSSPAEGSSSWHRKIQSALIERVMK